MFVKIKIEINQTKQASKKATRNQEEWLNRFNKKLSLSLWTK